MTTTDMQAKFPNVSCSQCGRDFGPGNSGFSDCRSHAFLDWLYREGCLLDEPTKDQCIAAQRRAFEAALASRPDAQADERGENPNRASDDPGGQECMKCGCIFVGGPEHDICGICAAAPQAEAAQGVPEDVIDAVSKALRRAWQLGQTYWQQADSDSYKQQDKSDETQKKFEKLLDETRSMLAAPSPNRETCRRCGGTGLVDDGEITGSEGAEFENGPVKCVKDCPACATPSPDREQAGEEGCCDTPSLCSSVRRCTAKDASPSRECGEQQGKIINEYPANPAELRRHARAIRMKDQACLEAACVLEWAALEIEGLRCRLEGASAPTLGEQPQAAEPRGLSDEEREAVEWATGEAYSLAKSAVGGTLMFTRWHALCALLEKGE